jgi:hypothetical protein
MNVLARLDERAHVHEQLRCRACASRRPEGGCDAVDGARFASIARRALDCSATWIAPGANSAKLREDQLVVRLRRGVGTIAPSRSRDRVRIDRRLSRDAVRIH